MNKPKAIGTAAETAVVRYLVAHGWPHAERRTLKGRLDQGDVTGTPGIVWEVKGGEAAKSASDLLVADWLAETACEVLNANADLGVLVLQRRGVGPANAGRWWTVMPYVVMHDLSGGSDRFVQPEIWDDVDRTPVRMLLADTVRLLCRAGYGTKHPAEVPA